MLAVALALVIRVFGDATDGFSRLRFLFDRAFNLLAILLVVVFQPELRAAMGRLGRAQFFAARRVQVSGLAEEIAERIARGAGNPRAASSACTFSTRSAAKSSCGNLRDSTSQNAASRSMPRYFTPGMRCTAGAMDAVSDPVPQPYSTTTSPLFSERSRTI